MCWRVATTTRSPSIGKRAVKKGPAPRVPADGAVPSAPLDADVPSPALQMPLQSPVSGEPTSGAVSSKTFCPDSPGPLSPRTARPRERPPDRPQPVPERPPLPSSRASVVPPSPGVKVKSGSSSFERAGSPSVSGTPGDERTPVLYPSLVEFEAGTSSGGETPVKKHVRNTSDTGLPNRSRPTAVPPPPPVVR